MVRWSFVVAPAIAAAALLAPHAQAGSVTFQAVDVRVLPDVNPFTEDGLDWLRGDAVGTWAQGISSVGTGALNSIGDESIASNLNAYLAFGEELTGLDRDTSLATVSHQLASGGSVNFSVAADDNPGLFTGVIAIDRSAPEGFDPLRITGASYSGQDDEFNIDFSAFPSLISGDSFAFDLEFSATEVGDYSATVTLATDTPGLAIPFTINASITASGSDGGSGPDTPNVVPTPSAALGGLLLIGGLAARRRREGISR